MRRILVAFLAVGFLYFDPCINLTHDPCHIARVLSQCSKKLVNLSMYKSRHRYETLRENIVCGLGKVPVQLRCQIQTEASTEYPGKAPPQYLVMIFHLS